MLLRIPNQMENKFCWKLHYWDASGSHLVGRGTVEHIRQISINLPNFYAALFQLLLKVCKSIIYVWFIETTNIPLPRFERTLTGVAAKMQQ